MSDYYREENLCKEETVILPSGNYRLVIRYFKTKEGYWNYTQGQIYRLDGKFVTSIERNYHYFHYNFICNGKKEYLITGRSYMGTTIVDLETGQEWDFQPKKESICPAEWQLAPDNKTLIVRACAWGGPYVYLFYDFDLTKFDPEKGLPRLTYDESNLDEEGKLSFFRGCDVPIKGDFILDPNEWYFVFTHTEKYNTKVKMLLSDLYYNDQLQLLPEDLSKQLISFKEKSSGEKKDQWQEEIELIKLCKPYYEADCVEVNLQEAILQRDGDKMKLLLFRQFNLETEEME